MPDYVMQDEDENWGTATGTYTVSGNLLTVTLGGEDSTMWMTTDAQVLVNGYFERSVDNGVDWWEAVIAIGVQADSCD